MPVLRRLLLLLLFIPCHSNYSIQLLSLIVPTDLCLELVVWVCSNNIQTHAMNKRKYRVSHAGLEKELRRRKSDTASDDSKSFKMDFPLRRELEAGIT